MHTFQSLSAILHDEPHNICAVFVADLHLSMHSSALNAAFLALIEQLIELPNLRDLYILGDWLDAWLGDDALVQNSWLIPIISALKTLSLRTNISVMHGNRDFMIGRALCAQFNAQLLPQPSFVNHHEYVIRLEHGDALCTDDVAYQRYRKFITHPITKYTLSILPLWARKKIAGNIKSTANEQKQHKATAIMDVNPAAVNKAMLNIDVLIHGHTHRPAIHYLPSHHKQTKTRVVLGDWHTIKADCAYNNSIVKVEAIIGIMLNNPSNENIIQLARFEY